MVNKSINNDNINSSNLVNDDNFNGIVCFTVPGATLGAFVALNKCTGGVFGTKRKAIVICKFISLVC